MRLKIKTLTLLFSLLFAACNNPSIESLAISPKSATINIGETLQINVISTPVYENSAFTWSSTDNGVATVDSNGVVTAMGVGNAKIRCKYLDILATSATITVVDPTPEPVGEPRTLESLLTQRLIFSSRQLTYPGTVMQCFDFHDPSANGYIYFSQCAGDTATGSKWMVVLSRVKRGNYGDNTRSGETMKLRWFGHGTNLCVEKATDGGEDFVWVNSNGTISGNDYANNKTFCRMRYKPDAVYEHYAGENFYLDTYTEPSGKKWTVYNIQATPDFDNRLLLVTGSSSGRRHFIVYNLDEVFALKEQPVTLTRTWGGEDGTNTERKQRTTSLNARILDNLNPIGAFNITSNINSGDYTKPWSLSFQGQGIYGDKILWYEGQPLEAKAGSGVYDNAQAYLEVYDYKGNRVKPRTKVVAASDFDNLKRLINLNDNLYSEAEGLQIKNGGKTLYLGLTTHIAGATSKNRLATILEYDYSL